MSHERPAVDVLLELRELGRHVLRTCRREEILNRAPRPMLLRKRAIQLLEGAKREDIIDYAISNWLDDDYEVISLWRSFKAAQCERMTYSQISLWNYALNLNVSPLYRGSQDTYLLSWRTNAARVIRRLTEANKPSLAIRQPIIDALSAKLVIVDESIAKRPPRLS